MFIHSFSMGCHPPLLARATKAPFSLTIPLERLVQCLRVEIGPIAVGEVQLGVCKLPDRKVRNSLFSAGSNEQIGLWGIRERKIRCELTLIDQIGRFTKMRTLSQQGAHRVKYVPTPTVVSCHGKMEA